MIFNFKSTKDAETLQGHGADFFAPLEDLKEVNGTGDSLTTSILEKAKEVGVGVHVYRLSGGSYTGTDLPSAAYAYSMARIEKKGTNDIVVTLLGVLSNNGKLSPPIFNVWSGAIWSGWKTLFTTDGGTVNGNVICHADGENPVVVKVENSLNALSLYMKKDGVCGLWNPNRGEWVIESALNGKTTYSEGTLKGDLTIQKHSNGYAKVLKNHSETADYGSLFTDVAKDGKRASVAVIANLNKAIFEGNDGTAKELLHTGNSAKVVINETAPSDTSALWVY